MSETLQEKQPIQKTSFDEETIYTIKKIIEKIPNFIEEFKTKQLERDELIQILLLGLFSTKNVFLLGEPGVSKTKSLEIFMTGVDIDDSQRFDIQVKDDTKYGELFGNTYRDKNGKLTVDKNNTLLVAVTAVIDEIWKGNSKILNSLLSITSNERTAYVDGIGKIKSPLQFVGAASNELPLEEVLAALNDRFILRYEVLRIQDDKNWLRLINRDFDTNPRMKNKFKVEEINFIFNIAKKIKHPEYIQNIFLKIKNNALSLKMTMSDRRFEGAALVIATSAVLNGRLESNRSDLFILNHILWTTLEEKKIIKTVMHDILFGNEDYVTKKIIDINEYYKTYKSYEKNNFFNSLLNYRTKFLVDQDGEFPQAINQMKNLLSHFYKVHNDIQDIFNIYNDNRVLEKELEENIVATNYKSLVFQKVNIDNLKQLQQENLQTIKNIEEWLNNSKTLFNYNTQRHKKIEGLI